MLNSSNGSGSQFSSFITKRSVAPKGLSLVKLSFFVILLLLAIVYALPNFLGDDWAVQLSVKENNTLSQDELIRRATQLLNEHHITVIKHQQRSDAQGVWLCFQNNDQQLAAKEILQNAMPDCVTTLGLVTRTPNYLRAIGAKPMRLGLDLRGGVHLLLAIDLDSYFTQYYKQQITDVITQLNKQQLTIRDTTTLAASGFKLFLPDNKQAQQAATFIKKTLLDYQIDHLETTNDGTGVIQLSLVQQAKETLIERVLEQTVQVVQNRVNELGVSEAVVQRQGQMHISVDLPGVQDIARAKELLGKTATLRFQLVVEPIGDQHIQVGHEVYDYYGHSIALQPEVVLDGSAITYAVASVDQWGKPAVQVELAASAASRFHQATAANVGHAIAVVYSQMEQVCHSYQNKEYCFNVPNEKIISVATIRSALTDRFEVSGLSSERTAEDLALLLRSGSLAAPVSVIHEVTVGPSLGQANIERGAWSLVAGLALIAIFMVVYYGQFGLIADFTLLFNLLFMVAMLSMLDATLTMAGMAGMVLTIGMAVDASVLILERIREELRAGYGSYMAIQMGYQRALATILDSNLSTLIISAVLFSLTSGAVKGFAVTLTVGILTSMLTAVVYSKLMTEAFFEWYGRKHWGDRLPVGIQVKRRYTTS